METQTFLEAGAESQLLVMLRRLLAAVEFDMVLIREVVAVVRALLEIREERERLSTMLNCLKSKRLILNILFCGKKKD